MIISFATDYREGARRRIPPFLFHNLDGGSGAEQTLRANIDDLQQVKLCQRVLKGSEQLGLATERPIQVLLQTAIRVTSTADLSDYWKPRTNTLTLKRISYS